MTRHVTGDSQGSLSYAQINTFFECKDGVSIGFITIVVLGILTMWYIFFTKLTMGRRKRELVEIDQAYNLDDIIDYIKSVITSGRFPKYLLQY